MNMQCAVWHAVMVSRETHQVMADYIKLSGDSLSPSREGLLERSVLFRGMCLY